MNIINTVKRQSNPNESIDFFETQFRTVDYLFKCIGYHFLMNYQQLNEKMVVCDFSCGRGAIINSYKKLQEEKLDQFHLDNCDIEFYQSDIIKYPNHEHNIHDMFSVTSDFFSDKDKKYIIIMNPPFNQLDETMSHFLKLQSENDNILIVALLHPLRSLEGINRLKIMNKYQKLPSLIVNMVTRQAFNTYFDNTSDVWTPPFSVVWSVWENRRCFETRFIYV